MNAFYNKLSEFRKSCLQSVSASPFLRESSRLYFLLMTTHTEVTGQEWADVLAFKKNVPENHEELFHYLWFLNAVARYHCFILKDFDEALRLTHITIKESEKIFQQNFAEENLEKRSILFILTLNIVRLSFYQKNYYLCSKQLAEFKSLLNKGAKIAGGYFPENLKSLLNSVGIDLVAGMKEEDLDYYREKLTKVEERLQSLNLLKCCLSHAKNTSEQIAFTDYDQSKNYKWNDVENISNGIAALIGSDNQYVLICTQQNILFPTAIIAAWKTGNTPVMIHESYTPHELQQLEINLKDKQVVVLLDDQFDSKIIIKFQNKFKNTVLINEKNLTLASPQKENSLGKMHYALGLFTSGSSGPPKLCLFTHQNLFQAAQIEAQNEPLFKNGSIANLRPHYTSAGLNSLWPSLMLGSRNVLSEKIRKTPMGRFLNQLIRKESLTMLILSPTYILSLFQNADSDPHSDRKLPLYFGGSSLPWSLIKKLLENNFLPSMRYGMTEVAHIVSKISYHLTQDHYDKADVGIPFKNFELRCVDGFVQIKSPGNISLVIDQGVQQQLSLEEGLRTADSAEFNSQGPLIMTGRDNHTINVNGFRFNSQQVEEVLTESPLILDCRVIGIKNSNEEQELTAYILVKKTQQDFLSIEQSLRNLAKENLSPFKQPQVYFFLHEFSMGPNGKIDFNKLTKA